MLTSTFEPECTFEMNFSLPCFPCTAAGQCHYYSADFVKFFVLMINHALLGTLYLLLHPEVLYITMYLPTMSDRHAVGN